MRPRALEEGSVKPSLVTLVIALASHEMLVVTPIIVQVAHDVVEVVDNRLVAAVARSVGAEVAAAGCRTWSVRWAPARVRFRVSSTAHAAAG